MHCYELNPSHQAGQFQRTIRLPNREPRFVRFTVGGSVELDRLEAEFMSKEIAAGVVGLAGCTFPVPEKPEPARRDPREDPVDENFDEIPYQELSGWRRCLRDAARRAGFYIER